MKNKFLVGLVLGVALTIVVGAWATNGDQVEERLVEGHQILTYKMLDGQTTALTTGQVQYVGGYEAVSFYMDAGVDASNTVEIECGIGRTTNAEPSVWHTVHTASAIEARRLEDGDACPWVRINKATSDNTATTVLMVVVRSRR